MTGKPSKREPSPAALKQQIGTLKGEMDTMKEKLGELSALKEQNSELKSMLNIVLDNLQKRQEPPLGVQERAFKEDRERLAESVLGNSHHQTGAPIDRSEVPALDDGDQSNTLMLDASVPTAGFDDDEPAPSARDFATDAINRPAMTEHRERMVTEDEYTGQFERRLMRSRGDAMDSLDPIRVADAGVEGSSIEVVGKLSKDELAFRAFMSEKVCILVHDTTDDTETPVPQVCVGEISQYFIRGRKQWVKRFFVERLARAKITTYTQVKEKDDNGDDTYVNIPHTKLMYPFSLIEDRNPRGPAWLQKVLAEV